MKPWVPPRAVEGIHSYTIAPAGPDAWRVTVHRLGTVDEPIPAATRAEACRLARPLSDAGMLGIIRETAPWTA